MKKGMIAALLMMIMLITCMSSALAVTFSDLESSHWAYEYITTLADGGVINGYTDGTFRPSGKITRAEFIKLMTVATIGEEEANKIVIPGDYYLGAKWYAKYIYWAEENNTLMDYFSEWDYPINRLEMVRILYAYTKYAGILNKKNENTEEEKEVKKIDYNDIETLDQGSTAFLEIVSNLNLINGYTDGSFKPYKFMTRAEVATIIYRYYNLKG